MTLTSLYARLYGRRVAADWAVLAVKAITGDANSRLRTWPYIRKIKAFN